MIDFSNISKITIQKFSQKIGYDISMYIDLYSYFIQNAQPNITRYFLEPDNEPSVDSFDYLDKMITESIKIDNLIKINKNRFDNIEYWDTLDLLEDIKISLLTCSKTSKYTRSSKTQNSWRSTGIVTEHVMSSNETIEQITFNELSSEDSNIEWQELAIQNQMSEIDYTTEGGKVLTIHKGIKYGKLLYLNSIIDNLFGEKLYGLDLHKKLTFVNDDFNILSYNDTFIQSVSILALLSKGDIPEFQNLGRSRKLAVGSNINVFEFGLLIRQMEDSFATDDSLVNFNVNEFYYSEGDLFIEYQVDSFYNLTYKNTIKA